MKKQRPNTAIKNQIIKDACQYFKMQEEALFNYSRALVQNTVLFAIYTESNYTHAETSAVFNITYCQASWFAMQAVVNAIRKKKPEAETILGFYREYGYCKHLWEGRKVA